MLIIKVIIIIIIMEATNVYLRIQQREKKTFFILSRVRCPVFAPGLG